MDETNQKSAPSTDAVYRFGLFVLDASAGLLSRNGLRIRLQDQPFQLLALLLEKHGQVVTREEIRQRLWKSNTFVDFDKSLGVAVLKVREALGDSAANPRFLETVPRRGYRFIAPVSDEVSSYQAHPALNANVSSHPSAQSSADSVVAQASAPDVAEAPAAPARLRIVWYTVAGIFAAIGLAFTAGRIHSHAPKEEAGPPTTTVQPKVRRSVAVLGFRNLTGGPDQKWLSAAFTEMLNTELGANGDLRLVSGEDVANVKHDLSLPDEDTLAKSTLGRIRSSLGADVVVVGSYTLLSDGEKTKVRLDIRAQDTALGETMFEDALTGNENDLFDLASQAGARLRESLSPSLSLAPATDVPRFSGSSNQLALQFYSEGRSRLYEFDFVGARDLLKRAVTADPDFALAHSALASALTSLGYEVQARDEAKRALEHAHGLPSEIVLTIQGQYQESIVDWPAAEQTYQRLLQLSPDNLTYGLQLARAQLHVNSAESAKTLARLRMLPAPVGDDPRIDLMEASALMALDLPKARMVAQNAIAKASAQRASLMVARGYGMLCQLDSAAGVPMDQSISECNLARNSFISAGDLNNAARALNDLAAIYYRQGNLVQAQAMWQEAIEVFRKVGDKEGLAASSNNVGDVLLNRGELKTARKLLEQALDGYRLTGDRAGMALAMVDLGQIDLLKGELAAARTNYQEAVTIAIQAGDKSAIAYGQVGLGDIFLEEDNLAEARKQYEKALQLRRDFGEKQAIVQTRVALARLLIEEGHAPDAEPEARQCLEELHQERLPDDEISAGIVLSETMLNQTKNDDAKKEIDALRPLAEKTLNRELQLRFSLEFARVLLAEHMLGSSRTVLGQVSTGAVSEGFASLAWEAQMDLARAQGEGGDAAGAVMVLKFLNEKERRSGFLLLARKADSIARLWHNAHK
jgi:DNA-binding winged helix-turn-helix (wHTH) protein/tetratricopeptide (TPR) repeat protein